MDEVTWKRIALIKAHALNTLSVLPEDVSARDKLFLISEIERLEMENEAAYYAAKEADVYD